jgi:hypothetical protein
MARSSFTELADPVNEAASISTPAPTARKYCAISMGALPLGELTRISYAF